MSINIPTQEDLSQLTKLRNAASVTLYIASSSNGSQTNRAPVAQDPEAAQVALRSAANQALRELKDANISQADRESINATITELDNDRGFWNTPARSVAVFASPQHSAAFRLMNELPQHVATGDRYDIGPLLRATTFEHNGYVLALTEGDVRLLYLDSNATSKVIALDTLPDDAAEALERTVTTGRFNRHRADGTLGPKTEQKRYCTIVQEAVLNAINVPDAPLVLASSEDLEPAYREINTYPGLLPKGIQANPSSLSLEELQERGRRVLDQHFAQELSNWREAFGTKRANGHASAQLSDIARAATQGLVDTFFFDLENNDEGSIDEGGAINFADSAGHHSYGIIDEIAARVLQTGGTVRAVRGEDLPDDSPVAATFRAAV